ncbi:MAG: DNA cytosine methyltransferase [Verrucomicrobia bacterium]|nr:DNA cytosine methyltransferase [Verrucomicrobiota bacterium]
MQTNGDHRSWLERRPDKPQGDLPTALSLFSGCGGFCEGVERGGFDVKYAVEIDQHACATYRHNFPTIPIFQGDVCSFLTEGSDAQPQQIAIQNIDLVFGGPPCQGFSQIGPRQLDDHRNILYREYLRIVQKLRPRVFMMENVPNLILLNKGHFRDLILRDFGNIGYSNVTYLKVCASDYGVPQDRNRVIFIGTRDEDRFPHELASFSESVLDDLRLPTPFNVWDAISDLPAKVVPSGKTMPYPEADNCKTKFQKLMRLDFDFGIYPKAVKRQRGISDGDLLLYNHHTKEMLDRRRKLISHLKPGFKGDSLPKGIWNGLRPEKWRRLHPERPAYTILAQMHRDLSEWVHPNLERWITVREAARLQSFHDGFVFVGSEWQQLKQIGNAVPPLLGAALGRLGLALVEELRDARPHSRRRLPVQEALALREEARRMKVNRCRMSSRKQTARR